MPVHVHAPSGHVPPSTLTEPMRQAPVPAPVHVHDPVVHVPEVGAAGQGLTLVHIFAHSTRADFVTKTSQAPHHMGPKMLTLSRKVDECKPLPLAWCRHPCMSRCPCRRTCTRRRSRCRQSGPDGLHSPSYSHQLKPLVSRVK